MTENIDPECSFEHQTQVGKESLEFYEMLIKFVFWLIMIMHF